MTTAAFVPGAPLLLPGVTGGPVDHARELLAACREVVATVVATRPQRLTVVGAGPAGQGGGPVRWPTSLTGTVAGLGAPQPAGDRSELPLPLTVARWLLRDAGWDGAGNAPDRLQQLTVPCDLPADACLTLGLSLADGALLVVADGSCRRGDKPPGGPDSRAEGFDAAVRDALATGDTGALGGVDSALAAELGVAGRAPWQVLAGWAGSRTVQGRVVHDSAPFGVGYLVGGWTVTDGVPGEREPGRPGLVTGHRHRR